MIITLVPITVICLALIYAAISDAAVMKITNRATGLVLISSILALVLSAQPLEILSLHAASGGIMFAFGFLLFAVGGFGAGDAKLMAAVALLFQPFELASFVLATTLYGGALAIVMMVWGRYVPVRLATHPLFSSLFMNSKKMPYGIAISAAALTLLPNSELVMFLLP